MTDKPDLSPERLDELKGWVVIQNFCSGSHRGIGMEECPRGRHHHHDKTCEIGRDLLAVITMARAKQAAELNASIMSGKALEHMRDLVDALEETARLQSEVEQAERERDALRQLADDLMTLLHVCDAAANCSRHGHTFAVEDAHDIAHVLEGGDQMRSWAGIRLMLSNDHDCDFGPALPYVRLHVMDVLKRAEEMRK